MPALSSGPITADQDDASAHAACTRTIVALEGSFFIIHLLTESNARLEATVRNLTICASGALFVRLPGRATTTRLLP